MRVSILGSGCMGGKLGTLLTRAEHVVVFSYARHHEKLKKAGARSRGERASGRTSEASEGADALLLAVQDAPLTLRFPIIVAWRATVSLNKSCCRRRRAWL